VRSKSSVQFQAAALRRAVTSLAARARVEREGTLTLNQVAVLGRVVTEGPLTAGELSAQLRMVPQSLTRPLAALESGGLLRRVPDPSDGRATLIEITAAGLLALRAEMAPRDRWLAGAVSATCSDEERAVLAQAANIMARLADYGGGVAPVEP
jgi:DNA-binding MarR family transcriptional regulator